MHDELNIDVVQAGEDDVAAVDVEVPGAETVSVLQFPLKMTEAGDILSRR